MKFTTTNRLPASRCKNVSSRLYVRIAISLAIVLCFLLAEQDGTAQLSQQSAAEQELGQLTIAVQKTQAQLAASQQQILSLQNQIDALRTQLVKDQCVAPPSSGMATQTPPASQNAAQLAAAINGLSERQQVQQSEIATHDQTKVESESGYPLKLTGLLLLSAFVDTGGVDVEQSPTSATMGVGTTSASVRQTVLGLDARGPHLFGGTTHADLRVDFFGYAAQNSYSNSGLLRMRTAHALLDWPNTEAFFSLDRPILSPEEPTSLTAVANPALAWSGNLWKWIPQLGVQHSFPVGSAQKIELQAALMDVPDSPYQASNDTDSSSESSPASTSLTEQSGWPGSEARIAWNSTNSGGAVVGVGGYFSPHSIPGYASFNAWAATLDYRFPLPEKLQLSGSFYRGLALGGLGGGTYKDYAYTSVADTYIVHPLDDVGGWAQLKIPVSERLELNAAYGMDSSFASQLRAYASPTFTYQDLARNRTFFTNVIYSPTASTVFSFEYRLMDSAPVTGASATTNVFGLAAGYKF